MTVSIKFSANELDWDKQGNMMPAVIQDAQTKDVLMLGYMTPEALSKTVETELVTFFSRSKQALWTKGETSGNTLSCLSISMDCDKDTLLIMARPAGPTCHTGTTTCFGDTQSNALSFLTELSGIIKARKENSDEKSYVHNLLNRGAAKVAQKVGEEGVEVAIAHTANDKEETREEAADLLFHLMILLEDADMSLSDITQTLESRHKSR
jgi:phosphoribosyl-ATP pyrophosphohydrolase/phosphoribosyl-AMP cyclohydrolase